MAPKEIVESRVMDAPVAAVWRVITDIHHAAEHLRGIDKIEVVEGDDYAVGFRWRETRKILGRATTEEMWVHDVRPMTSTQIRAESGGAAYTTTFTLQEIGPKTRVVVRFSGEPTEDASGVAKGVIAIFGGVGALATGSALRKQLEDIDKVACAQEATA